MTTNAPLADDGPDRSGYTPNELALTDAVRDANLSQIAHLVGLGTRLTLYDEESQCLLSLAIGGIHMRGQSPATLLLLGLGADPNFPNWDGDTPLHQASFFGLTPIVALLLSRGADPHAQNPLGHLPATFAHGNPDILGLLGETNPQTA